MNEGSFMWAVEQMKQGKKVRRKIWNKETYYSLDDVNQVEIHNAGSPDTHYAILALINVEATDWEVVEPKKTLWDKRDITCPVCTYTGFDEEDVREALKEFLNEFVVLKYSDEELDKIRYSVIMNKAKSIFGEEFLK